jgi:hypothetical protein
LKQHQGERQIKHPHAHLHKPNVPLPAAKSMEQSPQARGDVAGQASSWHHVVFLGKSNQMLLGMKQILTQYSKF